MSKVYNKYNLVIFFLILFLPLSFFLGSIILNKAPKVPIVQVNNGGEAWGIVNGVLPKNPCGLSYVLDEVKELGNTVNLYNCPYGEAFERGLSKPYQISSVIYQAYYKKFDRVAWLSTLRSSYHSYLDMYDYQHPAIAFFFSDKDNWSSLYITISSSRVQYCIGPNEEYIHNNGNTYTIKGGQILGTIITRGKCDERVKKAQEYKFVIKTI